MMPKETKQAVSVLYVSGATDPSIKNPGELLEDYYKRFIKKKLGGSQDIPQPKEMAGFRWDLFSPLEKQAPTLYEVLNSSLKKLASLKIDEKNGIDKLNVYILIMSMGGAGFFYMLKQYPDFLETMRNYKDIGVEIKPVFVNARVNGCELLEKLNTNLPIAKPFIPKAILDMGESNFSKENSKA